MREIEQTFIDVKRYELFTRIDHQRTRPFYLSLGYTPFRTQKVSESLTFVHLQKFNERQADHRIPSTESWKTG